MSADNTTIIIGNLTRDPEMKYASNGNARTKFTVAVNHKFKDASGNLQEDPSFIPVTVWGPSAEACANHLSKGAEVAVEGRIRTFTVGEGDEKKYLWELKANDVKFLRRGKDDGGQANSKPAQNVAEEPEECPF